MSVEIICEHCSARVEFHTRDEGVDAPCPNCKMTVSVPTRYQVSSQPISSQASRLDRTIPQPASPLRSSRSTPRFQETRRVAPRASKPEPTNSKSKIFGVVALLLTFLSTGLVAARVMRKLDDKRRRNRPVVRAQNQPDVGVLQPPKHWAWNAQELMDNPPEGREISLPTQVEMGTLRPFIPDHHLEHLVLVRSFDAQGNAVGRCLGVILNEFGQVLVPYSAVQTASLVQANFPFPMQTKDFTAYRKIRPDLDLAILNYQAPRPGEREFGRERIFQMNMQRKKEIFCSDEEPSPNDLVHCVMSVSDRIGMRATISRGKVVQCISTSELPEKEKAYVESFGGKTDHRWIEFKPNTNDLTLGGIVVDHKERVLGIVLWTNGKSVFALHAAHIVPMVDTPFPGPISLEKGQRDNPRPLTVDVDD